MQEDEPTLPSLAGCATGSTDSKRPNTESASAPLRYSTLDSQMLPRPPRTGCEDFYASCSRFISPGHLRAPKEHEVFRGTRRLVQAALSTSPVHKLISTHMSRGETKVY